MFLFLGRFSTVRQFLFQNANNGVLVGVSDHKFLKKSNISRLYISFQWAANNVEVDYSPTFYFGSKSPQLIYFKIVGAMSKWIEGPQVLEIFSASLG